MAPKLLAEIGDLTNAGIANTHLVGLPLTLATRAAALAMVRGLLAAPKGRPRWICFLNAHTFNNAMIDAACRDALDRACAVFPDGVAIRCAARMCGMRVPENLPGTDLVPDALASVSGGRCFLIGHTAKEVGRAAHLLASRFPGWSVVGSSSGYFASYEEELRVIERVNRAKPDLLMLGMGTPQQERFIALHAQKLNVPLCICVGGLFGYWSRRLVRAPVMVRRLRLEWLWILLQQPRKLSRYTIGIAMFFARVLARRIFARKDVEARCCGRQ